MIANPTAARRHEACRIVRHVDGDTTEVEIDFGFKLRFGIDIRWLGLDAPNRSTPLGRISAEAVNARLPSGSTCILYTVKTKGGADKKEKYGRYLGEFCLVADGTEVSVNEWLIAAGHAVPYDGGPRKPDLT